MVNLNLCLDEILLLYYVSNFYFILIFNWNDVSWNMKYFPHLFLSIHKSSFMLSIIIYFHFIVCFLHFKFSIGFLRQFLEDLKFTKTFNKTWIRNAHDLNWLKIIVLQQYQHPYYYLLLSNLYYYIELENKFCCVLTLKNLIQ